MKRKKINKHHRDFNAPENKKAQDELGLLQLDCMLLDGRKQLEFILIAPESSCGA